MTEYPATGAPRFTEKSEGLGVIVSGGMVQGVFCCEHSIGTGVAAGARFPIG